MAQLAEVCPFRPRPREIPRYQRPLAWRHRSAALRSLAEEMLQEMAFVCKATRSIRESMLEALASAEECELNPAQHPVPSF
jgi:hypothetical protein